MTTEMTSDMGGMDRINYLELKIWELKLRPIKINQTLSECNISQAYMIRDLTNEVNDLKTRLVFASKALDDICEDECQNFGKHVMGIVTEAILGLKEMQVNKSQAKETVK